MSAVTELEASRMWCPMVRFVDRTGEVARNRIDAPVNAHYACIGGRCMMWRWKGHPMKQSRPVMGYCGLAGSEVTL